MLLIDMQGGHGEQEGQKGVARRDKAAECKAHCSAGKGSTLLDARVCV